MPAKRKKKSKPTPFKRALRNWVAYNLLVPLVWALTRVLRWTWRARRINHQISGKRPLLFALRHGDVITAATEAPYLVPGLDVLISQSRDGTLVSRFARMYGIHVIRGGSSQGGAEALRAICRCLDLGHAVIMPVDGPRGPEGIVKPGLVAAAAHTGAIIIPGAVRASRAWTFRSWDKASIPKPFAVVEFHYGEPITVPRDATREQIEAIRLQVERTIQKHHSDPLQTAPGAVAPGQNLSR